MTRTLGAVAKSPEEIDRALTVLAFYGGNAERAATELGNIVSARTLRTWRSTLYRDRYLEIAEREGPKLEALAAAQARELLIRASHVEHDIIDRLHEKPIDATTGLEVSLSSKELSELAGALQRVTTSKGINTTKLLELTGRPTAIVEHRDPRAEIRAMAREFGITIESTAEEIPTAVLPPGKANANAREPHLGAVQTTEAPPAD
jgi:hypothetical protein